MLQNSDQRTRMVGAVALILLGAVLLLDNFLGVEITPWMWIIGLGVVAVIFAWVYVQERVEWTALVAYISGAVAVLILLATQVVSDSVLIPTYVLLAIAVPFVFAWWLNRKNWGLLIPAYVLVAIVPILFLGDSDSASDLVAPYVMAVIGAPFILAFVLTRQWPFLIPGGIMWVIGAFLLVGTPGAAAQASTLLIALVLIGGGLLLLFRRGESPEKRKNE
jgi:hypothetical protein